VFESLTPHQLIHVKSPVERPGFLLLYVRIWSALTRAQTCATASWSPALIILSCLPALFDAANGLATAVVFPRVGSWRASNYYSVLARECSTRAKNTTKAGPQGDICHQSLRFFSSDSRFFVMRVMQLQKTVYLIDACPSSYASP
jgi:hypothetical protein